MPTGALLTTINDVILAPALGAFFYDDQAAIRQGREPDGVAYLGAPVTPGFAAVRVPAAALSVGLVLSNGAVAWGDMVSVQYSGAAGRDPVFQVAPMSRLVEEVVAPRLVGRTAADAMANCVAALAPHNEARLPVAVHYGISQALLNAEALARGLTVAEVICDDYRLPLPTRPVPIFAQSGDARHDNVDKMILKRVDMLPHGLINSREKFGVNGEVFLDYIRWVAQRIRALAPEEYQPVLHFDVYGWIGIGIATDPAVIAAFAARAAEQAPGFKINIESPADYGSIDAQIENYARIVEEVDARSDSVGIVADEHCNTLGDVRRFAEARAAHIVQIKTPDMGSLFDTADAILFAKAHGIGAYSGGTSAETDLSARTCVHVAVACQADMMLAKPGMGVDEAITIVGNEQARLIAAMRARNARGAAA
jgi:methylaspartate ammonia-lyase